MDGDTLNAGGRESERKVEVRDRKKKWRIARTHLWTCFVSVS